MASIVPEMKLPAAVKPVFMNVLNPRSLEVGGFPVVGTSHVDPALVEATQRPLAYILGGLTTYAYVPVDGFATGRTISAYRVPAVNVGGETKFAAKNAPAPFEKPGIVVIARSGPVGKSPLVALIETLRFGVVPVQAEQNKKRSARVN